MKALEQYTVQLLKVKNIPMIFCGTEPFSPPDTTLFERLTQKYIDKNASSLTKDILRLFNAFC